MREVFMLKFEEWKKDHNGNKSQMISKEKYDEMIKVLSGGKSGQKSKQDYNWLAQYKLINFGESESVIVRIKDLKQHSTKGNHTCEVDLNKLQILAHEEELFSILHQAHCKDLGHCHSRKMHEHLMKYYINFSRPLCDLYVSLCSICCQTKKTTAKPEGFKPILSETFNSRGQVDLIDMQASPDGQYKWILNYMDHLTKFCYLRSLISKCKKYSIYVKFGEQIV